jgi:inositol-phosphate phosphatase / L-galactose 1-phosphate phosphatase / histidinol-phosphatase
MAFLAPLPLVSAHGRATAPLTPRRRRLGRRARAAPAAAAPPVADAASADRVSDEVARVAARAADAARLVTSRYFRSPALRVDFKADESPVTAADREAEQAIRDVVLSSFPAHTFLGEEGGVEAGEGEEWTWVADPIDGTKSFVSGKATFGTLIAVLRHGWPVYGLIDQPITGERWCGGVGRPTTLNGEPAHVRSGYEAVTSPEEAESLLAACICFATHPDMFVGIDSVAFRDLSSAVKHVMYGCDCYAYALLASGHTDLVVEADLKVWDFAALAPVVIGAGGVMTDWSGMPLHLNSDGRVVASASLELHQLVLGKLSTATTSARFGDGEDAAVDGALPADPGDGHVESMTGYGEGEAAAPGGDYAVSVSLRSVNSRYCDVQYRGPRFLAPFEAEFTAMIKRALNRGKVTFTVCIQSAGDDVGADAAPSSEVGAPSALPIAPADAPSLSTASKGKLSLAVDEEAVRLARGLLDQIAATAGIESRPTVSDLLTFSEILVKRDPGQGAAAVAPFVKEAICEAIAQLVVARRREGAILERDLLTRCAEIERVIAEIERRAPVRLDRELKRMQARVGAVRASVAAGDILPGRLEQEIALVADRIDITEELVRLRSHCELFKLTFCGVSEPVGQRLAFMLQEMHREATTVASKASDASIAQLAVLIKQELEKIREQVMNLC